MSQNRHEIASDPAVMRVINGLVAIALLGLAGVVTAILTGTEASTVALISGVPIGATSALPAIIARSKPGYEQLQAAGGLEKEPTKVVPAEGSEPFPTKETEGDVQ